MRRFLYVIIILLAAIIPLLVIAVLPWKTRYKFFGKLYQFACKVLNIELAVKGEISTQNPLVFVGNHTSYLDIIILGAALPASFVSKASVANWPLIGQVGSLMGTLFIKRDRKLADGHVTQMYAALKKGRSLIFFPEGTTADGIRTLPFKTSLFKLAERHEVFIQPVTIRYSHINGLPIHRNEKTLTAWIGDMTLIPHLRDLFRLGRLRVEVVVHEAIAPAKNTDRKVLAKQCQEIVQAAY